MENNSGADRLAATICPASTERSSTTPLIGDTMVALLRIACWDANCACARSTLACALATFARARPNAARDAVKLLCDVTPR